MQLTKSLLFLLSTSTALACKCLNNGGGKNNAATETCCRNNNGVFQYGEDCNAGSISQHLSNFRSCCRDKGAQSSDCDFRIIPETQKDGEGEGEKVEAKATH